MRVEIDSQGALTLPVRLTDEELAGLGKAFNKVLSPVGVKVVSLFGSRTDPVKKGGDIDLLVICTKPLIQPQTKMTRLLLMAIEDEIGEQKIDIVWDMPGEDNPFIKHAREEGRVIWQVKEGK